MIKALKTIIEGICDKIIKNIGKKSRASQSQKIHINFFQIKKVFILD